MQLPRMTQAVNPCWMKLVSLALMSWLFPGLANAEKRPALSLPPLCYKPPVSILRPQEEPPSLYRKAPGPLVQLGAALGSTPATGRRLAEMPRVEPRVDVDFKLLVQVPARDIDPGILISPSEDVETHRLGSPRTRR